MSAYLFEDYRDWYQEHIVSRIQDTDIRARAALLNVHYGKENRVENEPSCIAIWGHYDDNLDRKLRDIDAILTTVYHFPVGSSSGCSGRWRAKPEEIAEIKGELRRRIETTQARLDAYDAAIFPPEEPKIPAPEMFVKQASLWGD